MDMRCSYEDWGTNPLQAMQNAYRERHARLWGPPPAPRLALPPVKPEPVKPVEVVVALVKPALPTPPEPDSPTEAPIEPAISVPPPLVAMHLARTILREVAEKHGVLIEDIVGRRRQAKFMKARREACWRLYNETLWSLPKIGRFLNKDHTSILAAVRRCEKLGMVRYVVRPSKFGGERCAHAVDAEQVAA